MIILKDQIQSIFNSFKNYLPEIKAGNKNIPMNISGFTKEGSKGKFPYFFIDKFDVKKDLKNRKSHRKYVYGDVQEDDKGKFAEKKHRPIPYYLTFPLEFVDSNRLRYTKIKTELMKWFEKYKEISVVYPDNITINELIEIDTDPLENTMNEILKHIFTL